MRTLGIIMIIFGSLFAITRGCMNVYSGYEYDKTIGSNWDLADRASTLAQKSEYVNKFVIALDSCKLDGINNSIFLATPDRGFSENMRALKSLQNRLIQISCMSESDFAYQTALQQITAQEQGEAHELTRNLYGCWQKVNHYTLWNDLISLSFLLLQFIIIVVGGALTFND